MKKETLPWLGAWFESQRIFNFEVLKKLCYLFFFFCGLQRSPVGHCRVASLTLGQGEATFPQVKLQSPSLHQPMSCLQDLWSEGLRLALLVWGFTAPGARFGSDAPRWGGCLWLLGDAIEILYWIFAPFSPSTATTAGKHFYLDSGVGADHKNLFLPLFYAATSAGGKCCIWFRQKTTRQFYFDTDSREFEASDPRMSHIKPPERKA